MRALAVALLALATAPAIAGQPAPTVPNRTAVGPVVSPTIEIRAGHTAPHAIGSRGLGGGLWIGNPPVSARAPAQVPAFGLLPACSPGSGPCNFETSSPHQGGGD
jgi:hypothetical protein